MKVFLDAAGMYYKSEEKKVPGDMEKSVVNQDFIDALPENGSSIKPEDLDERIVNLLRVRRGDLTAAEIATQAVVVKAKKMS